MQCTPRLNRELKPGRVCGATCLSTTGPVSIHHGAEWGWTIRFMDFTKMPAPSVYSLCISTSQTVKSIVSVLFWNYIFWEGLYKDICPFPYPISFPPFLSPSFPSSLPPSLPFFSWGQNPEPCSCPVLSAPRTPAHAQKQEPPSPPL